MICRLVALLKSPALRLFLKPHLLSLIAPQSVLIAQSSLAHPTLHIGSLYNRPHRRVFVPALYQIISYVILLKDLSSI